MSDRVQSALAAAIADIRDAGHTVEAQDIPGLYRINGGPELTVGQMLGVAAALNLARGRA